MTAGRGTNQYATRGSPVGALPRHNVAAAAAAFTADEINEQAAFAFSDRSLSRVREDPDCPRWLVHHAASDSSSRMRRNAAVHANCPPEDLAVLANDTDVAVVADALTNPACPPNPTRLRRWIAVTKTGTIVATSDDANAMSAVAVTENGATVRRVAAAEYDDGRFIILNAHLPPVLIDRPHPTMMTSDTGAQVPVPNGAYPIDEIEHGVAVRLTLPDGTSGWVHLEAFGEPCEDCDDGKVIEPSRSDKVNVQDCARCRGLARDFTATQRAAVAQPPPTADVWWNP